MRSFSCCPPPPSQVVRSRSANRSVAFERAGNGRQLDEAGGLQAPGAGQGGIPLGGTEVGSAASLVVQDLLWSDPGGRTDRGVEVGACVIFVQNTRAFPVFFFFFCRWGLLCGGPGRGARAAPSATPPPPHPGCPHALQVPHRDRGGAGCLFGGYLTATFLKRHRLTRLVRSHQVVAAGAERVVLPSPAVLDEEGTPVASGAVFEQWTVFSASSYPNGQVVQCLAA